MQAPAYVRTKNFLENAGSSTDHGAVNAELDKVGLSIAGLRSNAALLQNDDGTLKPSVVELSSLTADALAALQVPGPRGPDGPPGAGIQGPQGEKGNVGASFNADARDLFAFRSTFNSQEKGYSFLAIDTGLMYFKLSGTSGDWSPGFTYGKGETGATGTQGVQGIQGIQGLQGIQGIAGVGAAGVNGADGAVATIDVSTKTASLIGRTSVAARLVLISGELSIVLTTV